MAIKTVGLGLHFLLELAALAAVAYWGFHTGALWWQKVLLGILIPLLIAAAWGIFRVPNDPGPAVVAVPGWLRLLFELLVMVGAAGALYAAGRPSLGLAFAVLVGIDYVIMWERVVRLVTG